ncbi:ABC transporter ATP-binding protein PstB [Patulibacter medicamentivorans]|uniref:ABC transporter ATP-binding protein PstB n=1 Tax=Patulibacter medicamentivorans TaxID=1097667 RepID=H0EBD6_9ACTN|nr:ABC transporter ATP-binding protein PstB [Patulibacter medicamentivorans]
MALFSFEGVTVQGEDRPRLDAIDLELPEGGVTAIVGPSGSGKSTLLRCANRLQAPDDGIVRYRGRDLAQIDVLAHRREVGMVFQRPVAFPGTVAENLRVADPDLDDAAAGALLERVALDAALLGRQASELSGGEAQRMGLARSLATSPRVVLADEPTASLDEDAAHQLEQLLRRLADDGVDVLLVSHSPEQVQRLADRVVALREGRLEHGPQPVAAAEARP